MAEPKTVTQHKASFRISVSDFYGAVATAKNKKSVIYMGLATEIEEYANTSKDVIFEKGTRSTKTVNDVLTFTLTFES